MRSTSGACLVGLAAAMLLSFPSPASATTPSNDSIENATEAHLGFSDVVNMAEATAEDAIDPFAAQAFCGYDDSVWAGSVWYKFTAYGDAVVHVDASASDFVPDIVVMTSVFEPELLQLQTCDSHKSSFSTTRGQTYYIGVANGSQVGTLRVSFGKGSVTPLVHVTVNSVRLLRHAENAVRIRGKYSCRHANYVDVYAQVFQDRDEFGEFQVSGEAGVQLFAARCDGKRRSWTVVVQTAAAGHFHQGAALVGTFSNVASCSTSGCLSPSTTTFPAHWMDLRPRRSR
jgi:hypothetical protein